MKAHTPYDASRGRRRLTKLLAAALSAALLVSASPAFAGKLDRVRAAAKGKKKKRSARGSSSSSYGGGSTGGYYSDSGSSVFAFYLVASPWWLPYSALGDDWGRPFAFADYPYANGSPGFVRQSGRDQPFVDGPGGRPVLGAGTSLRFATEGAFIDSATTRLGLAGRISGVSRFELETRWDLFAELRPAGAIDQLWLGDVNVTWQHAVGRHAQFRSGIGLRSLVDRGAATWGINFTYGFDLYPAEPLVLHASADIGNVGEALVTELRASAGVMVGPMEVFGGYTQIWVDDVDLGGPTLGVRLWR